MPMICFIFLFFALCIGRLILADSEDEHCEENPVWPCDLKKSCPSEHQYISQHSAFASAGRHAQMALQGSFDSFLPQLLQIFSLSNDLQLALFVNTSDIPSLATYLSANPFVVYGNHSQVSSPSVEEYYFPSGSIRIPHQGKPARLDFPTLEAAGEVVRRRYNASDAAATSDPMCVLRALFRPAPALRPLLAAALKAVRLDPGQRFAAWYSASPGVPQNSSAPRDPATCDAYLAVPLVPPAPVYAVSDTHEFKWACAQVNASVHFLDLGLDHKGRPDGLRNALADFLVAGRAAVLVHDNSTFGRVLAAIGNKTCVVAGSLLHCEALGWQPRPLAAPEPQRPPIIGDDLLDDFAADLAFAGDGTGPPRASLLTQRRAQQWIHDWQNPPDAQCQSAKFLLLSPMSCGIGSMIHSAAAAFATALCGGRILALTSPDISCFEKEPPRWTAGAPCPPNTSWLECFFQPVTSCATPNLRDAPLLVAPDARPGAVFLRANLATLDRRAAIPRGPCGYCMPRGRQGHQPKPGPLQQRFPGGPSAAVGQLIRYLLRPREWFASQVRDFLEAQSVLLSHLHKPLPFASMHVRYGDKGVEAKLKPLQAYISAARATRLPRVFVSTETTAVVHHLAAQNHSFEVLFVDYKRKEKAIYGADPVAEFVATWANLLVALRGSAFIGTVSSNWCRLIFELAASSRQPHRQILSLDQTKAWSICFPP